MKNEIIYKGEFKKNIPKKGRNIKLYRLNGYLKYEGDIENFLYEGNGKIIYENNENIFKGIFKEGNKLYGIFYEKSRKIYEGEFENEKLNGYGKIYNLDNDNNNYLFYEGNFEDSEIFGKGIRYYINGSKKIEGYFKNNILFNGKYYDKNNILIFKGEVSPEILSSNKFSLFNDNGENIYNDKINEIRQYENKNYLNKTIREINAIFLSNRFPGKTCLIERLTRNRFPNSSIATIGICRNPIFYEYKTDLYKLKIWDTWGAERYRNITSNYFNKQDIIIFVFDLSQEENIDRYFFDLIEENSYSEKKKLIYLVGNKLDVSGEYLERYREISEELIQKGEINKYFEVSAKTGEGIEKFANTLKIDSALFYMTFKFDEKKIQKKKHQNHIVNLSEKLKKLDEDLSQYLIDIENNIQYLYKEVDNNDDKLFPKLNKFIDY